MSKAAQTIRSLPKAGVHGSRPGGGFTLIELLTVISIIALLAAIGASMAGVAGRKATESKLRSERDKLVTAIESYHADFNQYPPDNAQNGVNVNPVIHQLYYELTGTVSTNQGRVYLSGDAGERLTETAIKTAFHGAGGFVNAAAYPEKPKNYLRGLKPTQVKDIDLPGGTEVELLVAPAPWPRKWQNLAPLRGLSTDWRVLEINPWNYVSTKPTNNPASFDLWAVWATGRVVNGTNEYRFFGNWKE